MNAPTATMTTEKTVWLRGRPVRGFIGGLLFGLGIALVAHALKLVAFDDAMFTFFPLGCAVVSALRAARGSAYRVEVRDTETPAPIEPE